MIKLQKYLAISVSIAVLLVFSLQLDFLLAGKIPQTHTATMIARFLSFLGDGFFLIVVSALLFTYGYILKRPDMTEAGRTGVFAVVLSGAAVNFLKAAFERPRIAYSADPVLKLVGNPHILDLSGKFSSFPSGHTTIGFALAYVLSKNYPRLRYIFYIVALLIAASRVWLGSHYPSDVTAGALLGICVGHLVATKVNPGEKRLIAGLSFLILFISFFKTGSFFLFDVDEAVFSEASREMVETGDVITPTYNYEPRYDKPILFYWFMSLAFRVFGLSEFAARFTSASFGSLLVFMTFLFIRRLKGTMPALFVSAALLLNIEYFVYTHSAVTDMTLAFFITASVYSFYLGVHDDNTKWFVPFWVSSALAVLTKGAIGLIFPFAVVFLFLAASKDLKKIKGLVRPSYILLFLLVALPWFAAEFYINGWDFFNAFIIKHHIKRYSGVISSHGGPIYYYIIVLLAGFFPWVAFLPEAVYRGIKERLKPASTLYLLASVWFLFVLIFFSIARTKLPNYIFPLFPPAAILSGLLCSEIAEGNKGRKYGLYVLIALSAIIGASMFILPHTLRIDIPGFTPTLFYTIGAIFLTIAFFSALAFFGTLPAFAGIAAMMVILIISLRVNALPPANIYLQRTLYLYSAYARSSLGKDDVLATYELNKPSIAFYARRKVLTIEKSETCNIKEYSKRGKLLVITTAKRYDEIKEYRGLHIIDTRGEYLLLGTEGLPPFAEPG